MALTRQGTYFLPGLGLIAAVIAADQYTKWLMMNVVLRPASVAAKTFGHWFITGEKIGFFVILRAHFKHMTLTPFLNLVMVWNQGVSFGMFDTHKPNIALVFIGVSLLASALMLIWLAFAATPSVAAALGLIVGGALGNVIDRVRFGAVVDFIDVHAGQYHWPAFNVADSCIVLGAGILILVTFLGDMREGRNKK